MKRLLIIILLWSALVVGYSQPVTPWGMGLISQPNYQQGQYYLHLTNSSFFLYSLSTNIVVTSNVSGGVYKYYINFIPPATPPVGSTNLWMFMAGGSAIVPVAVPGVSSNFLWEIMDGNYVISTATTNGDMWELGYTGLLPSP